MVLGWKHANSPAEQISGFRIYYGETSGQYQYFKDVPVTPDTSTGATAGGFVGVLSSLKENNTYFVSVTAVNSIGVQSPMSAELSFKTGAPVANKPEIRITKSEAKMVAGRLEFSFESTGGEVGAWYHIQESRDNMTWLTIDRFQLQDSTVPQIRKVVPPKTRTKGFYRIGTGQG